MSVGLVNFPFRPLRATRRASSKVLTGAKENRRGLQACDGAGASGYSAIGERARRETGGDAARHAAGAPGRHAGRRAPQASVGRERPRLRRRRHEPGLVAGQLQRAHLAAPSHRGSLAQRAVLDLHLRPVPPLQHPIDRDPARGARPPRARGRRERRADGAGRPGLPLAAQPRLAGHRQRRLLRPPRHRTGGVPPLVHPSAPASAVAAPNGDRRRQRRSRRVRRARSSTIPSSATRSSVG